MNRSRILSALESLTSLGHRLWGGHVSQLIPSPNGAYQAIALDGLEGASGHSTVIKVLRTGERAAHDTKAVQEVTLTCSLPPLIAWMSDNTLVIHERGAPSRPMMRGEVSFVFSPWKVEAPSVRRGEGEKAQGAACRLGLWFPGRDLSRRLRRARGRCLRGQGGHGADRPERQGRPRP